MHEGNEVEALQGLFAVWTLQNIEFTVYDDGLFAWMEVIVFLSFLHGWKNKMPLFSHGKALKIHWRIAS